jgi:CheY-like chemotaxis protein
MNVLLVDDAKFMRNWVRNSLSNVTAMGSAVYEEASTGTMALERLSKGGIDIVFLDWNMEGKKGIDVLREIRSNPLTSEIKVVMVTSETATENQEEALNAGADEYITKPLPADFIEKIEAVLEA